MREEGALVLFSGGQDSAVCLAWALANFARVETAGFDYGQRHGVEMKQRLVVRESLTAFSEWPPRLGEDHVIDIRGFGAIAETAMTDDVAITWDKDGLPNTFVPGRNLMFLTAAGALARRRGLSVLVGGMCENDFSGYPDCRRETLDAMQKALSLGMAHDVAIETPLMQLDKAQTWALAEALGGEALVELIVEDTHTCYLGERGERYSWGYGCGACPACELRARGWRTWRGEM